MSIDDNDYKWWRQYARQFAQPGAAEQWWLENGQVYSLPVAYEQFYQQPVQSSAAAIREQHDIWMQRLSGVQAAPPREAPSIEERRKALKAGEVITDPALLCKGMRVRSLATQYEYQTTERYERGWKALGRSGDVWKDVGQAFSDYLVSSEGMAFLGWASEGEGVKAGEFVAMDSAGSLTPAKSLRSMGQAERREEIKRRIDEFQPQPTPTPRALPFKRHPECTVAHAAIVGDRNCLGCERLIADEMAVLERDTKPENRHARPEPHTLAHSGMCGPIMGRRR